MQDFLRVRTSRFFFSKTKKKAVEIFSELVGIRVSIVSRFFSYFYLVTVLTKIMVKNFGEIFLGDSMPLHRNKVHI